MGLTVTCKHYLLLSFAVLLCMQVAAQKAVDTAKAPKIRLSNIFSFALNAVSRRPADSVIIKAKGETPFLPYQNKIIRHINFKEFGFDQSFTDTSTHSNYFGTKLLNKLHKRTKEWVVRDNLLLQEGTPLDAYKVSDNERYYRSLEFIQDARILVKPIPGDDDSVDLEVVTKDLFSLTGSLNSFAPGNYQISAGDVNVLGMGQKVFVSALEESNRSPSFGYSLLYTKTNVRHSFVNLAMGYSTIAPDLSYSTPDERAAFLSLQMPLVSQYAHFAGAFTIGRNETFNTYMKPDYLFYKYGYNTEDAWLGYNLDADRYVQHTHIKDKHFIALRYFKNSFYTAPGQVLGTYNFRYDNKEALLAQLTFFRQDFYKTNYIYGFGTTEDIPTGYNIAATTGWYNQNDLHRPYIGVNANRYIVNNRGSFTQYYLRAGTFFKDGGLQDASILAGVGYFSRLIVFDNFKIRQYINLSYTRLYNRVGLDALTINNVFGLRYFSSDSLMGDKRISLYSETFSFLKGKLFGFKFAPFIFGDGSLLEPEHRGFTASGFYDAIGGGMRTRNENFVFGTIELRFIYFPRDVPGNNTFKLTLTTNLNFRYNSNYITAPDIVQSNTDNNNGIY